MATKPLDDVFEIGTACRVHHGVLIVLRPAGNCATPWKRAHSRPADPGVIQGSVAGLAIAPVTSKNNSMDTGQKRLIICTARPATLREFIEFWEPRYFDDQE